MHETNATDEGIGFELEEVLNGEEEIRLYSAAARPPVQSLAEIDRQKRNYPQRLYAELGRISSQWVPGNHINRILTNFRGWEYAVEGLGVDRLSFLRKTIDPTLTLKLPPAIPNRREIFVDDEDCVTIKVQDDIRGTDLRCMLLIEGQIPEPVIEPEPIFSTIPLELPEPIIASSSTEGKPEFIPDRELFTDKEKEILRRLVHFNTSQKIAEDLKVSTTMVSRLKNSASRRVGINSTGTNGYMQLMLVAIALNMASIDHIPEGRTSSLQKPIDRKLLAYYYSPDPKKRSNAWGLPESRWNKVYKALDLPFHSQPGQKHMAVLYAVKDGLLRLPQIEDIYAGRAFSASETPSAS